MQQVREVDVVNQRQQPRHVRLARAVCVGEKAAVLGLETRPTRKDHREQLECETRVSKGIFFFFLNIKNEDNKLSKVYELKLNRIDSLLITLCAQTSGPGLSENWSMITLRCALLHGGESSLYNVRI